MTATAENPDTVGWAPPWVHEALPPGKFTRSIRELWADVVTLPDLPVGPTARLVALVLARFMDAQGCGARPSLTTLAKHAALGRSTVKRDLGELERVGLIARDPGNPKRSTRYSAELPACDPRPHGTITERSRKDQGVGHTVTHLGHDVAHLGQDVAGGRPPGSPSRPPHGPEVGLEVGHEVTKEAPKGADAHAAAVPAAPQPTTNSNGQPPPAPPGVDQARYDHFIARGHAPDVAAEYARNAS